MNRNLKIDLVMQNLDVYVRAKSAFMRTFIEMDRRSRYLEPQMDIISDAMKRLETEAKLHLTEMQNVREQLVAMIGKQGSAKEKEGAGSVQGIEKIENMVRVINDLNLYLDDPLLYDSFAAGAEGSCSSCSSTLCELISRNKQ